MSERDLYEQDKTQLWAHILTQVYGTSDLTQVKTDHANPEAYAFYFILAQCFTPCEKMDDMVRVDQELMIYLTCWSQWVAKGGRPLSGGPLGHNANYVLRRAFDGFVRTLRHAVEKNQIRHFEDGREMYGCFEVPRWFILNCFTRLHHHAEIEDEDRRRYPDMEEYWAEVNTGTPGVPLWR